MSQKLNLCTFLAHNFNVRTFFRPESFCAKNYAFRKVFDFSASDGGGGGGGDGGGDGEGFVLGKAVFVLGQTGFVLGITLKAGVVSGKAVVVLGEKRFSIGKVEFFCVSSGRCGGLHLRSFLIREPEEAGESTLGRVGVLGALHLLPAGDGLLRLGLHAPLVLVRHLVEPQLLPLRHSLPPEGHLHCHLHRHHRHRHRPPPGGALPAELLELHHLLRVLPLVLLTTCLKDLV